MNHLRSVVHALVLATVFSGSAFGFEGSAKPILIEDVKCVDTAYGKVVDAVVEYGAYSQIPEATLYVFGITMLKMIKSEATEKLPGRADDAVVYIEMKPLNFTEAKSAYFPRFNTRCTIASQTATRSRHVCRWVTDEDRAEFGGRINSNTSFGVSNFQSELFIEQGGAGCGARQTAMSYKVVIQPNSDEIDAMIKAWGAGSHLPLPIEQFFRSYYRNFYNGWIKRLGSL